MFRFMISYFVSGISFPCCISVNNCICHFSPTTNNKQEDVELKAGDLVKIDMGAHVDGFIAVVAHTIVVPGGEGDKKMAEGRKADAILAAHYASEAALRLVKPGQEVHIKSIILLCLIFHGMSLIGFAVKTGLLFVCDLFNEKI